MIDLRCMGGKGQALGAGRPRPAHGVKEGGPPLAARPDGRQSLRRHERVRA
jgi:hypothetical protein